MSNNKTVEKIVFAGLFAGASQQFKKWAKAQLTPEPRKVAHRHVEGCQCGFCLNLNGEPRPASPPAARSKTICVHVTPAMFMKMTKVAKARGEPVSTYAASVLERVIK